MLATAEKAGMISQATFSCGLSNIDTIVLAVQQIHSFISLVLTLDGI